MAATTVKIIDYSTYPARQQTVVLPGMPRPGELFMWDENDNQHTIQNIIWSPDDGGTLTVQIN